MECIILAGGMGTRLQGVIGEYPKCMAEVNGKPFLHYIFEYLQQQGCTRVILSLGFKYDVILDWLKKQSWPFEIDYVIERTALGTGGAINYAMWKAETEDVLALNGDTFFDVDLSRLMAFHKSTNADTTLALKGMQHFDRYGVVTTDHTNCITSFEEKKHYDEGWINGGIYVINKAALEARQLPTIYSFEKSYLEAFVTERKFYGFKCADYFIDIGIPVDYQKAQDDFKKLFN